MRNSIEAISEAALDEDEKHWRDIDFLDVLLPCREFAITYKVAEVGKIALTSEFLLRLVNCANGISESEAAAFFGFSEAEIGFVIEDLSGFGYLERKNGALSLTDAGRDLFVRGSDEPQIFEVEQRTERHRFDLISLCPAEGSTVSQFDSALPEFSVPEEQAAKSAKQIPDSFKKHFDALVRRSTGVSLKRSLYSVDVVSPLYRMATVVPVKVRARRDLPEIIEPDLTAAWSGYELDDRSRIIESAVSLLPLGCVTDGANYDPAFEALAHIAPDFMQTVIAGGNVRREALFREGVRRAGDLRADRRTIFLVGSVFVDRNIARVKRAIDLSLTDGEPGTPSPPLWHIPATPLWGATRRLPALIDAIAHLGGREPVSPIAFASRAPRWHIGKAFEDILCSDANRYHLGALEILLVPSRVVVALVHAPFSSTLPYPVPMGVLSFDPTVIDNATSLLGNLCVANRAWQRDNDMEVLVTQVRSILGDAWGEA